MLKSLVTECSDRPDRGSAGETSKVDIDKDSLVGECRPRSRSVSIIHPEQVGGALCGPHATNSTRFSRGVACAGGGRGGAHATCGGRRSTGRARSHEG